MKYFKTGLLFFLLVSAIGSRAQVDFFFTDAARPDSFSVAFELKDSLIRLTATVNGKEEHFVLDNGCPYLVINTRHWKQNVQYDSSVKARGVGGKVNAGSVFIDSFNWQGIQKQRFKVITADLPHLGDSICGLMGLDVYKDYRLTFDYQKGLISFVRPGVFATMTDTTANPVVIPYTLSGHLPVISCIIGREKLQMGIDCAASPNLMSAKLLSTLQGITNVRNTLLRGGGAPVMVMEGYIKELVIAGISYDGMKFTFDNNSLSQINQGRETVIEGLLGIPFLKQYKTIIDFPNQRVEVYRNN